MAKPVKTSKQKDLSDQQASDSAKSEQLMLINKDGALSGWPMIIGWLAMLVFTFHACTHMVAAGDTWVAMACGRHFVNHGVDTVEPFSANSHKAGPTEEEVKTWPKWAQWITDKVGLKTVKYWHPTGWVNQNWLTHEIFYKLVPKSSYADGVSFSSNALVYWKFAIYLIAIACVYYSSRILGVNRALAVVFSCFALFTGRSFLDIRPAGFSNMLVAVFLLVLILTTYRNVLYIWLIVPLTVFWCNVHGGYIYLFIMLVPFVIWHVLMLLPKKWTITGYCILSWIALYGLAYKFLGHESLKAIQMRSDWFFYLLFIFIAAGIAITTRRLIKEGVIYFYYICASLIVFLCLLPRFFPVLPRNIPPQKYADLLTYVKSSQLSFAAIFLFIMILELVLIAFKDRIILKIKPGGIYHTIAAGFVAFVAMVIFNPFHLTNLTHTFVISLSKHAERWRDIREWHPAFDWSNPVGTAVPFLVMYIIAWTALVIWIVVMILSRRTFSRTEKRKTKNTIEYEWPKIDFSVLVISTVTVYMAIRSRRFIPIAAIAACPIIALLIDQAIRAVSATVNYIKHNNPVVLSMPNTIRSFIILTGVLAVAYFGTWWGLKFKYVYLDPWPGDSKLNSVFIRMTASDAKPFYAMKFIRDNKLNGIMFNYWTEGGFIAWGEEPDPNTGHTPLQLFMDGRAQAAYNRKTFDIWTFIMTGGLEGSVGYQIVGNAQARASITGQELDDILTVDDYIKIGQSIGEELQKRNVWIAMMPTGQFNSIFMKGLERNPNWRTVFVNDRQKILVDTTTEQGKKLFLGIFDETTVYPDDFHRNLIRAHSWLMFKPGINEKKQGLEFAFQAFNDNPSRTAILEIMTYGENFDELAPEVDIFIENYFNNFLKNKDSWATQDGYRCKVEAVRLACFQLMKLAISQRDKKLENLYSAKSNEYLEEIISLAESKSW